MASKLIDVKLVADYFIWQSNKNHKKITNKKLQKLLYYSQAWHLVFSGSKLFKDNIEAWIHGPAIPPVYFEYKVFGYNPIIKKVPTSSIEQIDPDIIELLDEIWQVYGKYDAEYLEILTHNEAPWQKAREGLDVCDTSKNIIKTKDMKSFYSALLEKVNNASNTNS
jgi:uncharacterized phage-associated protein